MQVEQWGASLDQMHRRIARRFSRAEPRARSLGYLRGLLGTAQRKNGWQLAEELGEATPDGVASGCSTPPTGTPTPCAMTCASTRWSTWPTATAC